MSPRPDPQAPDARKPARRIHPVFWILVTIVIVGFIAIRLQQGARLQHLANPPVGASQGLAKPG